MDLHSHRTNHIFVIVVLVYVQVPIEIPVENSKKKYYMAFKGRYQQPKTNVESVYNRRLTW